ncbi:hypothetical protein THII_2322 [Thioploca ingrica]|uniref:Secreted protein n=1 Tax=Thioploca ingrica TaxID=40754 RepID=A0A090AH95_9GAMM|nr:hypothetical protein THII_2322 [Thioploca ingrica]
MRNLIFQLLKILPLTVALMAPTYADSIKGLSTYKGAWFDIQYPSNFKVRPSLKSSSSVSGYDSAFFTSPDGTVEFYVFSPQWNGDPIEDIAIDPEEEVYETQKQEEKNGKKVCWVTISAKDKAYTRSYMDVEDTTSNTRLVFGIKYHNQKAYDKYKPAYLKFKGSLKQYAD